MWLTLALMTSTAAQAGPWVLPEGSATVFAGVGAGTFQVGLSGLPRDRQVQARGVGYAAVGLPGKLEASVSVPGVASFVVDDPEQGPCPSADDYCAATVSVGTVTATLRRQLLTAPVPIALGLALYGDPWNARTRGRWTNVGQGVVGAGLTAASGTQDEVGGTTLGLDLSAGWWPNLGRTATATTGETRRAPVGPITADVGLWARRGVLTGTLSGLVRQRLGGVPYGAEWVEDWRGSEDRWAVTAYGELRAEAKLSWAFAEDWGLHASVSRSVVVRAGPPDLWDAGLGVHRYWAPRER